MNSRPDRTGELLRLSSLSEDDPEEDEEEDEEPASEDKMTRFDFLVFPILKSGLKNPNNFVFWS